MGLLSKCSRAGHAIVGAISANSFGVLRSSKETILSAANTASILCQQQRSFVQMRTNLKVADNSGAKRVMCIQVLKGRKEGGVLGDTIVASVKEAFPRGKVKKGDVVYGVIVRAAMKHGRCDGSELMFDDNAVVLVNKQGEPIGTRIAGPVPYELRRKHVKILALAGNIV